jgi:hypothetical protein
MWTGRRLKHIPQEILGKTMAQFVAPTMPGGMPTHVAHFEALKRLLDRREPDYRD